MRRKLPSMTSKMPTVLLHYGGAVVFTALAALMRWLLDPWLGNHLPLPTLYGAVALAVWLGGYRPALLVVVLGYFACDYLFTEPRGEFHVFDARVFVGLVLYLVSCGIIIGFGEVLRAARRQAVQQRESLRITLTSMGDAVITTDAAGLVTSLNPVATALTGWTPDEAVGRTLDEVFRIVNEQSRQPVDNPVRTVLAKGHVVGLANHTTLLARDGTERPIDDSAAPITDAAGRVLGVVLIFRDVTERRRAERSARLLASIVESSDDAIIGKDLNGIITSWNQAAERIFGYTAAEAIGRPVTMLAPPDRVDEMPAILTRLKQGERVEHFDTVRRAKDGRLVPISLTVSPVKDEDGEIVGASKIARDISERKRAEEALHEQKERLHATLTGIGDAVIVTDAEARVTMMNPVAQALTGWKDDATGRPLEEVFHIINEQTRQPVDSPVNRVMCEGVIVGLGNHTILIRKDDTKRPIDDSAAPIRDREGNVMGCILVFRDTSERRRTERALADREARIRAVVNTVIDGIVTIDEGGTIQSLNPAAVRLFGYQAEEVVGQNVRMLMPDPYRHEHDGYLANYLRSGQAQIIGVGREVEGCRKDGSTFPMELAVSEFRLGERRYFTGIVRDITERKQAEEALRQADRRKDEFLATLAHELRNPLAPIRNAVELLGRDRDDPALFEQARSILGRQLGQMVRLIDDLLDMSRISQGKVQLRKERVELAAVVRGAVETIRPFLDAQAHELTITLPPESIFLDADPTRLAQVLSNLLHNAAKYTERGGHIWLTAERRDNEVQVSVRDDGIGIAAEHLPHLFEMFTQASPALERAQGGLGIGLSLVRGLVEPHGGTVEARSAGIGRGSEFIVCLPVVAGAPVPSAERPGEDDTTPQDGPKCRVLVVDDNRDAADSLALMLRLAGHDSRTAYDGLEAVQTAATFRPEVVVLDIGLPKLNGYEAARQIRQQPGSEGTVLIALTGWGQDEDKRRASEAGFDYHLTKPVEVAALESLLASTSTGPAR